MTKSEAFKNINICLMRLSRNGFLVILIVLICGSTAVSESNSRVYSEIFSSLYDTHRIVSKEPFLDSVIKVLDGDIKHDLDSKAGKVEAAKSILDELYRRYDVRNSDHVDQLSEEARNSGTSLDAFNEDREFFSSLIDDELRANIFIDILILMIPQMRKTLKSHAWLKFIRSTYLSRIERGIYEFRSAHQSAMQMRISGVSEELSYFDQNNDEQSVVLSLEDLIARVDSMFTNAGSKEDPSLYMNLISELSQISSSDSYRIYNLMDTNYLNEISVQVKSAQRDFSTPMNTIAEVQKGIDRLAEVKEVMRSGYAYLSRVVERFPIVVEEYDLKLKYLDDLVESLESKVSVRSENSLQMSIIGHIRLVRKIYSDQKQALSERENDAAAILKKVRLVLTAVELRLAEIRILSAGGRIEDIQPVIQKNSELDRGLQQFFGVVDERIDAEEKSPIEIRNEQLVKAFVENDLSFGIAPVFALMEIIDRGHRQPELYTYLRNKIMEPFAGNITLFFKAFLALYPDRLEDVYLAFEEKIAPKTHHAAIDKSIYAQKKKIFIELVQILYAVAIQNPEYFVVLRESRLKFEKSHRSSTYPKGKSGNRYYLEDLLFYTALDNSHHKKRLSCEAFIALGKTFNRRVQ